MFLNKITRIIGRILKIGVIFLMITAPVVVTAQKLTHIKGTVIDAKTKEPLPYVNIVFEGKNIDKKPEERVKTKIKK